MLGRLGVALAHADSFVDAVARWLFYRELQNKHSMYRGVSPQGVVNSTDCTSVRARFTEFSLVSDKSRLLQV